MTMAQLDADISRELDEIEAHARRLVARVAELEAALNEISECADGREDIDGNGNANLAMRVAMIVNAALAAKGKA
jgi:prefoldin subunit 5